MNNFNPNTQETDDNEWGSYIPGMNTKNRGPWKTHRRYQDAYSAVCGAMNRTGADMIIYKKVDGRWYQHERYVWNRTEWQKERFEAF